MIDERLRRKHEPRARYGRIAPRGRAMRGWIGAGVAGSRPRLRLAWHPPASRAAWDRPPRVPAPRESGGPFLCKKKLDGTDITSNLISRVIKVRKSSMAKTRTLATAAPTLQAIADRVGVSRVAVGHVLLGTG